MQSKLKWNEIRTAGVLRIDRKAEEFDVWVDQSLPFAKFRVKVIERIGKGFLALPNVAIRNLHSGNPEFTSGLGDSIGEALEDGLRAFWVEIEKNSPKRTLTIDDFCWSAAEDF